MQVSGVGNSILSGLYALTRPGGTRVQSTRNDDAGRIEPAHAPRSEGEHKHEDRVELSAEASRLHDQELTDEERQQVAQLTARDREVRAHEQAHKAQGGQYAGGISYQYTRGPDGAQYATGGEVPIDVAPVQGDPAQTIAKMQQVRRAALAPAQPSNADRKVAAQAQRTESQARREAQEAKRDPSNDEGAAGPATEDADAVATAIEVDPATGVYRAGTSFSTSEAIAFDRVA